MPLVRIRAHTTQIDCPNCARTAEYEISRIEGITNARINFLAGKIVYTYNSDLVDQQTLNMKIEKLGHFKFQNNGKAQKDKLPFSRSLLFSLIISIFLVAVGLFMIEVYSNTILGRILIYGAILISGYDIFLRAFKGLIHKRLDINALMTIAIIGAIIIDELFDGNELYEAAAIVILFGLANMLESYSIWRLSKSLNASKDFTSETALLKVDNEIREVEPEMLMLGDIVILKEGMSIPADGVITSGTSSVDLSTLTGEVLPQAVKIGDKLFAGTINIDGYLEMEVSSTWEDSRISKILTMVGDAAERKSKIEKIVDRFAKIYTPIVVVLAILIATIPPLLLSASFDTWFYRALVFLVISCPCALVISTPVAITAAISAATKLKAYFKGGEAVERLANINTTAFDKTGTLTSGELELQEVKVLHEIEGLTQNDILQIATSLEQVSNHPLAKAINRKAKEQNIELIEVTNLKATPGIGIEGIINGISYQLGSEDLLDENNKNQLKEDYSVFLIADKKPISGFRFTDRLRFEVKDVITELRKNGIDQIGILSGDKESNVEKLTEDLQLDFAYGSLFPDEKYQVLSKLDGNVAMIGDGINDSVALSGADVSISLSRLGNEMPTELSDIALFGDTLKNLPALFSLSKRTVKIIKSNIAFALVIKVIFLGLAVIGFANIWMAVVADMGASLLVIANSMRLLKSKK